MPPEARLVGLILLLVYPAGLAAQTEFSSKIVANSPDTPAREADPVVWVNPHQPVPPPTVSPAVSPTVSPAVSPMVSPAERLGRARSQPSRFLPSDPESSVEGDFQSDGLLPTVNSAGSESSGVTSLPESPAEPLDVANPDAANPDGEYPNTESPDSEHPPKNTASSYPALPPRGTRSSNPAGESSNQLGGIGSLMTVGGSLALVLGLFMMMAWIMRRTVPGAVRALPGEVVEVLGRAPLAGRQQVHLVRCGCKLLLVSVTPEGAETLTEITDSEEVDRLAGLCRETHPGSATNAFRHVFGQLARQRTDAEMVVDSGELDLSGMGFAQSAARGAGEQR